jgi:hypothetical protein
LGSVTTYNSDRFQYIEIDQSKTTSHPHAFRGRVLWRSGSGQKGVGAIGRTNPPLTLHRKVICAKSNKKIQRDPYESVTQTN